MVREMKHTEIGEIPAEWELQTFEETFRMLSNNTLPRADLNNRGGTVRNVHYGDILTRFGEVLDCEKDEVPYLNDGALLTASAQVLQDGDVILADTAEDDTVGKAAEVYGLGKGRMVAGLHTIPCRVKKGNFVPKWLGYYMNSSLYHDQVLPYITGIKVSSISRMAISETLIAVPPLEEQKAIVSALSEVDRLLVELKKVVSKLRDFKRGCLYLMFPQEGANIPQMREPGYDEPWEQRKLSEIADLASSKRVHAQDYVDSGIPFYRGKEISELKEHKPVSEVLYITENKYNEIVKLYGSPQVGDLLITAVGTIGNTWVVDNVPFYFKDGNLIWLKNIKCNSSYLDYVLSSDDGQKKIDTLAIGSNQKALTMVKLNELKFMFPNDDEQAKIADCFITLDYLITLHQQKFDKYAQIKKAMISELITGKIKLV